MSSYYRNPPTRPYGSGGGIGMPPVTPAVRAIMIACGAVWGLQFVLGPLFQAAALEPLLGLVPERVLRGWVWQPFTYMWLHAAADPFHLLFNLFALWMFGGDLERHWGSRRFVVYYLVCGVGAGLFILGAGLLSSGAARGVTIGASGAVYGLIAAYGMIFAERVILFMLLFPLRARTFAWIMLAVTFVFTARRGTDPVSHVAHLGGMVVGYLYLKRVWNVGSFYRDLRWRLRRRRFRVMGPRDEDRWVN